MSDQLHHLLRMSVRPYLTLRVVPAALGAHAGIAGHFTLLEFAELKPVAYLDSQTSSLFLGRAGGDLRLPAHPGDAGRDCPERGRITGAD